jgi:hypothetical protein
VWTEYGARAQRQTEDRPLYGDISLLESKPQTSSRIGVSLSHDHNVDVLILAEAQISQDVLLEALNRSRIAKFRRPLNVSPRLLFFTKYPSKSFKSILDDGVPEALPSKGP